MLCLFEIGLVQIVCFFISVLTKLKNVVQKANKVAEVQRAEQP